jgi:hypothetical protein
VRFIWLDSLPGLNGDEAWNGLWVERWLQDHAWGGIAPSGRYPNFFLLGPLADVQAIADPAPWVLRVPTVISDLAFIVVGVIALRRTIGSQAALIFALLAATAPITVMYSRIGWEPSQTPLATMIFLWACLAGKRVAAVLSLFAAIVVHPMNVFLTPILVAFCLHYARSPILKIPGRIAPSILFSALLIGGALAAIPVSLWVGRAPLGELFSRNSFPTHFINAILSFADLLSGITTYTYIVGDPTGLFAHRMVSLGLLAGIVLVLFLDRRCPSGPLMRILFVGFACSLISFLIVAGPVGLRPNSERYAYLRLPQFWYYFHGP